MPDQNQENTAKSIHAVSGNYYPVGATGGSIPDRQDEQKPEVTSANLEMDHLFYRDQQKNRFGGDPYLYNNTPAVNINRADES